MDYKVVFLLFIFSFSCLGVLLREELTSDVQKSAVCNDGSNAIYFIERTASSKWVIFLESGGACFDYYSCTERIHKQPYLTGSKLYPSFVYGEDILSSNEANNFAYDFNKVLIPYCSSDLWLGNSTVTMAGNNNKLEISFKGYQIFSSVLKDLDLLGLKNSSEILLAGSSAGGIGVINQADFINRNYQAKVSVLADSSWFINYNNLLSGDDMKGFMQQINAVVLHQCMDRTYDYPCCLSIFCMVTRGYFPSDVQLFALISRNDVYLLSKGIIAPEKLTSLTKTTKIVTDMLSFGGEISHSVGLTKTLKNVHTIVTACIQHTFLATSSLWTPGGLFYSRSQTSLKFPMFIFHHSVSKERWNQVSVQHLTIQEIFANWYKSFVIARTNGTRDFERVEDRCKGVRCNPTCPQSITFHSAITNWPRWSQWLILLVYLFITLVCLFIKVFWIFKRTRENRIQNEFVLSLYRGSKEINAIGLPCCIPSNYLGISCLDVRYTVSSDKPKRSVSSEEKTPGFSAFRKRKHSVPIERREILKGVNAYFNPGQLIAIMGPSGSGKTTFLDILTGRKTDDRSSKVICFLSSF